MSEPHGKVTTRADFLHGSESKLALVQWALRFCQLPESLPVFCEWVRSLWPECTYTDEQIADELAKVHDIFTAFVLAGLRK